MYMKDLKKIIITLTILIIFILVLNKLPDESLNSKIKIGVSDDSSGLVINYMINSNKLKNADLDENFEPYFIKDCWGNTSQWALSSDVLDIAIMCPEAAKNLIENDDRFEISCPLVSNSDIFVLKDENKIKKIAMTQNRIYQEKIIKDEYGEKVQIYPMIYSSLPYALEKGRVDGIIIDSIKSLKLNGQKKALSINKNYTSYVLVIKKKFKKDKKFKEFITNYNKSVMELKRKDRIKNSIEDYKKINLSNEEVEQGLKLKVKFFLIPQQEY